MSPSTIPSPCGIPLIFSSVQIRLYSSSFGCCCYRSVSGSNLSRLIWSYFHMEDLAGGWWFCGRNKKNINSMNWRWICPHQKKDSAWFKFSSWIQEDISFSLLTYINTDDITLLYVTILWSQPSSPWMSNFSVVGVSQPPSLYWDVLLADKQWAAFRPAAVMGWQAKSWSLNQTWPMPLSEPGLCHSCLMRGG